MDMTPLLLLLCASVCCTAALSHLRQFHLIGKRLFWTKAQDYCRTHYTDLVTVYNQEEAEQLIQLMTSNGSYTAWIGLNRTKPSPKWSNGDPVDFTPLSPPPSPYTEPMCATILKDITTLQKCIQQKYFMCYKKGPRDSFLIEQNMTWYKAQRYCRENYTDLVSIMNEGQKEEVKKSVNASTTPFWIGLLYDDWEWSDGGRSSYRNWLLEPSDDKPRVKLVSPGVLVALGSDNLGDSLCYEDSVKIVEESKTWEQALDHCIKNYRGLLRIESEKDQRVVEQNLRRAGVNVSVWVGLRQSQLFGFWVWTNGLPVGWSNWEGDRQPEQPLSNHCGAMATVVGYKWSDQDCLSMFFFICEK
ncbi:unnamed protein product [Coregonus sp. 'balchen']|nr:unnamed protein product [Coregonus sp. 'balchen']